MSTQQAEQSNLNSFVRACVCVCVCQRVAGAAVQPQEASRSPPRLSKNYPWPLRVQARKNFIVRMLRYYSEAGERSSPTGAGTPPGLASAAHISSHASQRAAAPPHS